MFLSADLIGLFRQNLNLTYTGTGGGIDLMAKYRY